MRKKKVHDEHDNPDRWVVSYADFITLLFAFFTTMYAISHVDLGKLERFTGSMKSAFKASSPDAPDATVIEGIRPPNYADIILERDIRAEMKKFDIIEGVAVVRDGRGVVLSLGDSLLFESGSADLKHDGLPYLAAVASLIKKSQRNVIVEGHSDNMPLRNSSFPTNLELSSARASRAYGYLLDGEGVNPDHMSVAGYGEYRPVESNATPEGRTRNRRIDILFVTRKDGS